MRFSPTVLLLSQLRLARRISAAASSSASSRFSTVSAPNPNSSQQQKLLKIIGNSDLNLSNINQTSLLRVLNSTKDDPNLTLSLLHHLNQNRIPLNLTAYASLVRILSRWRLDRNLDSVLVELIKKEDCGFSVMELMETIVEDAVSAEEADRVSGSLVKTYANLNMFDEAVDVLYQSKRLGCVPGIKPCNFLMNRLVESGRTDMALALFRQLSQLGLSANDYTYAIAVKALCRKRDLDGAARLLEETTSSVFAYTTFVEGLCLNGRTGMAFGLVNELIHAEEALSGDALGFAFGMLVRGYCKEMNVEAAKEVLFKMEEFGVGPDVYACAEIIDRYCKDLELEKALGIVDVMLKKGIKINCVIVSSVLQCYCKMGALRKSDEFWIEALERFREFKEMDVFMDEVCYNAAFEALSRLERVEEAVELLEEMRGKGMVPDVINYTTLIGGYCLQGKFADALDLFDEMRAKGLAPDVITYNVIAGGLARSGHSEQALEVYKAMRKEGVEPTAVTHSVIIGGLCSAGRIEEAREFFTGLENKCPENYASLVRGYCDSGLPRDAYRKFVELNSPLPKSVCFKLFTALFEDRYCEGKALKVLIRMWAYGVEPARSMYGKMISKVDNVREAELVFDKMVGRGNLPDLVTYTIMIQTYCRLMELQKASDLFEAMKQRGIVPDLIVYTVLFHGYLKLGNETGCVEEKAKQIWKELAAACIEPDVNIYTVLMNHHCKIGNLEIATDILYRMIECGLKPDNVTYNALISAYDRKGHTDKAAALVTELSEKDVTLPEHLFAAVKRAMKTRRSPYRK